MNKTEAIAILKQHRIAVVIRLSDLSQAQALSEALLAGGIRILEFTLTNPDAYEAIIQLRKHISVFDSGEALLGIGSIRTAEQARRAIDSGAELLVSPILSHDMIEAGKSADVLTAPAGYTPSEIHFAQEAGADLVKVFPANTLGAEYIKSVLAPMPELQIMPTGGIDLNNINDYLKAGAIAVGVGSALLNKQHITDQNWQAITDTARQYVNAIGVNYA
ncbi:MAG: bifunctional 4-hydroxy-2-oxoglutarate aldolase/2-dehydro-3-deoxy-phosphogluconate aldolase [Anaerolineae bacterium]